MANDEIERKFVITKVPINLSHGVKIIQGYLAISEDGTEVRLRNKDGTCYLTVKSGGDLIRKEAEIEITEDSFNRLWELTENKRLEKARFKIHKESYIIELDIYSGALDGLMIAEVEFASFRESQEFIVPNWFEKEVTMDIRFKNKNLALFGKPIR